MKNKWQKKINSCLYLLVFLIPLFWLPITFEAFNFNKTYLLFLLTLVGILLWISKMIFKDKEIKFKKTPLDYVVLGFLALIIIGSFFSSDKVSLLLGSYGRFWPSLLGILSLGGFYFLATNNIGKKESGLVEFNGLIKTFLVSSFVVVIIGLLSIFGFWNLLGNNIPAIMSELSFNTIEGTLESLGMFLSIVTVLLVGILSFKEVFPFMKEKKNVIFSFISLSLTLVLLVLINIQYAWITLLLSFLAFIILSFRKRIFKDNVNRLGLPVFISLISLLFLFLNPLGYILNSDSNLMNLPYEVTLKQRSSWGIGIRGMAENPIFGSGLNNFQYDFSKFKPNGILQSSFWSSRFDRSGSHLAEILDTTGLSGFLGYLAFIGFVIFLGIKAINIKLKKNENTNPNKFPSLPLFLTFTTVIISQFFYYQNVVLAFVFWFILVGLVTSWKKEDSVKTFSFKEFPEIGLVFNVFFWLLVAGFIAFSFSLTKRYVADVNYIKYLNSNYEVEIIEKAVNLSPKNSVYRMTLAESYWTLFLRETEKEGSDDDYRANLITSSIDQAKVATELSPNKVATHEIMAIIYRDSIGAVNGAEDWSMQTFKKALELEPNNPAYLTELGRIEEYLGNSETAREYYQKAIDLESFYLTPNIQLAIIFEEEGDIDTAIGILEKAITINPYAVEARFQLGKLYYNNDELDKAEAQFETALLIYPNHSNSLYSLGLIYESRGDIDLAMEIFERVLKLNPGNKEIQNKINSIKNPVSGDNSEEVE